MRKSSVWVLLIVTCLAACSRAEPTFTPGQVIAANKDWSSFSKTISDVEMMMVPPGCFMMGSDTDADDEKPSTKICFDKPFWIDKTEVSQAQFTKIGGQKSFALSTIPELPVVQISWLEARDYCAKRDARLPTEAEWEYAARGPDDLRWTWGNEFDGNKLVWGIHFAAPVGSIPDSTSWVGTLDQSGNVGEWVSSIYQPYPYAANDGRENPDDITSQRTIRGEGVEYTVSFGTASDVAPYLRSSLRSPQNPDWSGFQNVGFRCAHS
ncbi:MAG: formylglycine-generating enzyme family protein [Chloroflexota bacterium]